MRVLVKLAVRYLAGRRLRTALTTLAVVFGVAVIFGVNALLPTMVTMLEGSLLGVSGQVDLTISSATGETFRTDALAVARRTRGVAAASPALRRQVDLAALAGGDATAPKVELVGVDVGTAELVRKYQMTAGRFLRQGDGRAAVVSQPFAAALKLGVGDEFLVPTPRGLIELQVVGIVAARGGDQLLVPLGTVQYEFLQPNRINTIDLALASGADRATVKANLEKALGPGYRVGSAALESAVFANIQIGLVGLNLFGILTLFMGGFLIFNTFRTSVVERQRDIGMLRALGATRRTIVGLIVIESTAQGVIGTAIGLALGYLFALAMVGAMQGMLEQFMRVRVQALVLPAEAFALAIGLGIGVTLIAGLSPAINASRVPVLAALRPHGAPPTVRRARIGKSTLVGGVLIALAMLGLLSGNANAAGLGALLCLAGLVAIAPALIRPVARFFEPALTLAFAREGLIAEGNVCRQPSRASVTASAIMIGLAIIVTVSGLLSSIEATFLNYLDRSLAADLILLPPSLVVWESNVGFGAEFERKLARIPGIGNWASLRHAAAQAEDVSVQVLAFDPATYPRVSSLSFDQGDAGAYAELNRGRTAIANPIFANTARLKVGDGVTVRTPDGPKRYRIVAVGSDYLAAKINTLYISQKNLAADFHKTEDILLLANLAPNAKPDRVKAAIAELLKSYPQITLHWGAEWRAEQRQLFAQMFAGLYVVLIVLIVPSLLGLINTLAIGVLERTREIGVLRAVGATRRQVRRLVLAESLLLSAAGAAFGMLAGLALGYGLTSLLAASMTSSLRYSFPAAGLVAAVAVALAMAVVASLLPARQAARLQIVRALQYE